MILSDKDIRNLIENSILGIEPFVISQIGPTSIDLRLGYTLVKYDAEIIDLGKATPKCTEILLNANEGYTLLPKEFVLGCTLEKIRMPNSYQGFIETKGDIARAGLQIHNCDGHVDPGNNNTITLEISNVNTIPIRIYPEIFICQMFIHSLTSECEQPYKGKYYGQTRPSAYKIK